MQKNVFGGLSTMILTQTRSGAFRCLALAARLSCGLSLMGPTGWSEPQRTCAVVKSVFTVRGTSMAEIYRDGQDVMVGEGVYSCEEPKRGDVVLIRRPGRPKDRLLKVIVMIPGDRFTLQALPDESFGIFINGGQQPLATPKGRVYKLRGAALSMMKLYQESLKGQVGAGLYFVMGTEPEGTLDSTRFGPVETQDLLGRVIDS